MKCSETRPLLDLLSDGALEPKDCALVLDHLKSCDQCQAEWNDLEHLRSRFAEAKEKSLMPVDMMNRISKAIDDEDTSARRTNIRRFIKPLAVPAVAAAVVLSGLFFYGFKHQGSTAQSSSTMAIADRLVDDLTAPGAVEQIGDRSQLSTRLGYDPRFIPLKSWQMDKLNIYRAQSQVPIARFDFIRPGASGLERLSCYQAPEGTIKAADGSRRVIGDKQVVFGNHGQYQFALFSQNGRDYLFVTPQPQSELEAIVKGA